MLPRRRRQSSAAHQFAGKPDGPCLNPECSNRTKKCQLTPIGLMPAEPIKGAHAFEGWGVVVQLIFRIGPKCYMIRVSNDCE